MTTIRALGLAAVVALGCGRSEEGTGLSRMVPDRYGAVPAETPHRLFALGDFAPILSEPRNGAKVVGHLRVGAPAKRSKSAARLDGCLVGWYAIYPRGFVCVDDQTATMNEEHPGLRSLPLPSDASRPLPFA